jgi:Saxitoxin biosynthesis operon protein SxtJ
LAHTVPARLSPQEGRKFGLTVGAAFLVISGISWWRGHHTAAPVFATIGALLVLGGLVAPTALGPVNKAWMGLALVLSKVTTPVFMGVVYFIILTPIGALRRAFGRNSLTAPTTENGGHWASKTPPVAGGMQRQF